MRRWLIELRKEKDLTQMAIASLAGITRAYYAQLELALRSPSIRVAKRLAEILEIEWTTFYNE